MLSCRSRRFPAQRAQSFNGYESHLDLVIAQGADEQIVGLGRSGGGDELQRRGANLRVHVAAQLGNLRWQWLAAFARPAS